MTQPTHQNETLYLHSHGRSYNLGWCGPESIVAGLKVIADHWENTGDLFSGRHRNSATSLTATFLVADHHTKGDRVYHRAVVGITIIGNKPKWHWCGEGVKPDGSNSNTICDYEPRKSELAIATVTAELANIQGQQPDSRIYRMRLDTDGTAPIEVSNI